ncbi:MAG: murein L,D-transpeptidase catalytic domain family protein [Bacteroidota bacterium]
MKTILSKFSLTILFCFFFFILHVPVIFGNSSVHEWKAKKSNNIISSNSMALYEALNLNSLGLSEQAYELAIKGFDNLKCEGKFNHQNIISIIDFTKPSAEKRLFIIDVENGKLLFNTYVAHGQNSGTLYAEKFSNKPSSFQSSLGFYETTETYIGKHGYSLQLNGLEKGINDKADSRAIVVHGASYVSEGIIRTQGYLGRSWGCPAVPEKLSKPIIDKIKNGTCMFIYGNDKNYFNRSAILNS